jgi:hypothetical protein
LLDPATGRFLTRGVYPGSPNPYVPWRGDPLGMMLGPLALVALIRGKRKGVRNGDISTQNTGIRSPQKIA